MLRPAFIEEVTRNQKASERVDSIIFLDIDWVIYNTNENNPDFIDRIFFNTDRISDERKKELIFGIDDIKRLPCIMEKNLDPVILAKLPNNAICGALGFDKNALENLRHLHKKYNAKIVISSSWRNELSLELRLEQLQALFHIAGFSDYKSIIGFTPKLNYPNDRTDEVESWLLENYLKVKSYIILDDQSFKFRQYFGQRFIHCIGGLISEQEYFDKADTMLGTVVDDNCHPVLQWNGISNNSENVKHIHFNKQCIPELKLYFGYSQKKLIHELFTILEKNTTITNLTLENFANNTEERELFKEKLTAFLGNCKMQLDHLGLMQNKIDNIDGILSKIDGKKLHIKYICFSNNPITEQEYLVEWIKTYPQSVTLNIFITDDDKEKLHIDVIKAALINKNVDIEIRRDLIAANEDIIKQFEAKNRGWLRVPHNRKFHLL